MKPAKTDLPVQERLGFLITQASWAIRGHMVRYIRSLGLELTPEQWIAINWLWSHRSVCQQELAQAMHKDKANITRVVNSLVKQGYLSRQPDPQDGRKHLLQLSPSGVKVMTEIMPKVMGEYRRITNELTEEEITTVKKALAKILSQVNQTSTE